MAILGTCITTFYVRYSSHLLDTIMMMILRRHGDRRTCNFELREIQWRKWFAYISISSRNQESKGKQIKTVGQEPLKNLLISLRDTLTSSAKQRNYQEKTITAEHLIVNWFESTGTLQLQGSQAAAYKAILIQLLAAETERESSNSHQRKEASTSTVLEETDAASPYDLRKEQSPVEAVLTSMFAKELDKIWTEINSLRNRFVQTDQPNKGDVNNIQLINTLQQAK